ncbi:hypothetical protein WDW37_01755 [Bdellovibrionota bacterium FG-1]
MKQIGLGIQKFRHNLVGALVLDAIVADAVAAEAIAEGALRRD